MGINNFITNNYVGFSFFLSLSLKFLEKEATLKKKSFDFLNVFDIT